MKSDNMKFKQSLVRGIMSMAISVHEIKFIVNNANLE